MTASATSSRARPARRATRHAEVSARIGAMIAMAVASRGIDAGKICRAAGFDPSLANDPSARISLAMEQALWDSAAEYTGDPDFGLHTAERIQTGVFDVLDYAVRTAPSLATALDCLVRYSGLEHDAAAFRVVAGRRFTRIEHSFEWGTVEPCRQEAEFTLASIVVIAREIVAGGIDPVRVQFMHAKPRSTSEHVRMFGVLPAFGAAVNALEVDTSAIDRPILTADSALSRIIQRHAEEMLGSVGSVSESTVDRVRRLLGGVLPQGPCSIRTAASQLGLSERTLQRRLEEEGSAFSVVLDDLRRDLALRYLENGKMSLTEIAYLLGHSEPSPFFRAFKKWTGSTPLSLRRLRIRSAD